MEKHRGKRKFAAQDLGISERTLYRKIKEYDLPIIPILSKSGGLHLYVFTSDFIPAKIIRSFLTNLIPIFNLKPETEVFPKQTELVKDNETGEGHVVNRVTNRKKGPRGIN